MSCIKEGLEQFCKAFDQRVNFEKSHMLLPLPEQEEADMASKMGIPRTKDLVKYLGFHINQVGRNTRAHQMLL